MSLMHVLVVDDLGYCCVKGFLKEAEKYSAKKVAQALGVTPNTICYWRDKLLLKKIPSCPRCRLLQKPFVLLKTDAGKIYVDRSHARSSGESSRKSSGNSRVSPIRSSSR